MTSPKITGFIAALILVGAFANVLIIVMSSFGENYNVDYSNTSLEKVALQFDNVNRIANQTSDKAQSLTIDSSWTDVLGAYLSGAYNSLKISVQSISVFKSMMEFASDTINVKGFIILKSALISIVIIMILVGILVAAIVQREL